MFFSMAMPLDTTYTAENVRGLLSELKTNPTRFKVTDTFFVHTGRSEW